MCPRHEPLALLDTHSHRFVIGGDGLYLEVHRFWIHVMLKVMDSPIPLPYGRAPEVFSMRLQRHALIGGLRRFIQRARDVSPLEHAAWLTFDPARTALGYLEPAVIARSGGHIRYHRPDAHPHCLPVVDCHSHGVFPAFFSSTDDDDDRTDDAKLAFVAGRLDQPEVSIAMRFVGFGLSVDISDWLRGLLYADPMTNETEPENDSHGL
jgi:PRTRC genetic system protein A